MFDWCALLCVALCVSVVLYVCMKSEFEHGPETTTIQPRNHDEKGGGGGGGEGRYDSQVEDGGRGRGDASERRARSSVDRI